MAQMHSLIENTTNFASLKQILHMNIQLNKTKIQQKLEII